MCQDKKGTESVASFISEKYPLVHLNWLTTLIDLNQDNTTVSTVPDAATYSFLFSQFTFYLFDPQTNQNDVNHSSPWCSQMRKEIERNQGQIVDDFNEFLEISE